MKNKSCNTRRAGSLPRAAGIALSVAVVSALTWSAMGCGYGPDATADDIEGVWRSNKGGKLQFREDGGFAAKDISLGCDPEGKFPLTRRVSGVGKWKMGGFRDEGPGATIVFRPPELGGKACMMWTAFVATEPRQLYLLQDDGEGERYKRTG